MPPKNPTAPPRPARTRVYVAQGTWGDESVFQAIQEQLDAIDELGGTAIQIAFQSPSKAAILATVPTNDTDEDAAEPK